LAIEKSKADIDRETKAKTEQISEANGNFTRAVMNDFIASGTELLKQD